MKAHEINKAAEALRVRASMADKAGFTDTCDAMDAAAEHLEEAAAILEVIDETAAQEREANA